MCLLIVCLKVLKCGVKEDHGVRKVGIGNADPDGGPGAEISGKGAGVGQVHDRFIKGESNGHRAAAGG